MYSESLILGLRGGVHGEERDDTPDEEGARHVEIFHACLPCLWRGMFVEIDGVHVDSEVESEDHDGHAHRGRGLAVDHVAKDKGEYEIGDTTEARHPSCKASRLCGKVIRRVIAFQHPFQIENHQVREQQADSRGPDQVYRR